MILELLDSNLRDGAYINDWEFGHDTFVNVFERVYDLCVEQIKTFINE